MASWTNLPTEVKLLIVRKYVDLVLAEIEPVNVINWAERMLSAVEQLLILTTALPFLRKDIIKYCNALKADCGGDIEIAYP